MTLSRTPNAGDSADEPAAPATPLELGSASERVVVAVFPNRHAAEHMLFSLGREFRKKARKGEMDAFLISRNADGSYSLAESRVLTASGLVSAVVGVSVATMAGLLGLLSTLKGARSVVHAARERGTHLDPGAEILPDILDQAGPGASVLLVRCADPEQGPAVTAEAAERAHDSWEASRDELIQILEQAAGDYGWLLAALGRRPDPAAGG